MRHCRGLEEFQCCAEIEQAVWGPEEAVPVPVFVVAAETGGQVLGAFFPGRMVGFTLALAAIHVDADGRFQPFLHSHMTAVLDAYRDRGVGRQLKLFQRKDALERGIRLVEWTFDPLEMRNAHFNLMRLGAVARRFLPNCYGITASPLHRGLPTDRLVAEWWLNSPRVAGLLEGQELRRPAGQCKTILVSRRLAEWRQTDRARAAEEQAKIARAFQRWLGQGYVVTGVENTPDGGAYLLEPYDQVREELHAHP